MDRTSFGASEAQRRQGAQGRREAWPGSLQRGLARSAGRFTLWPNAEDPDQDRANDQPRARTAHVQEVRLRGAPGEPRAAPMPQVRMRPSENVHPVPDRCAGSNSGEERAEWAASDRLPVRGLLSRMGCVTHARPERLLVVGRWVATTNALLRLSSGCCARIQIQVWNPMPKKERMLRGDRNEYYRRRNGRLKA